MGEADLSPGPSPQGGPPWWVVLGHSGAAGCVMGGHSWAPQLIFQSENTTLLFPKPGGLCVTVKQKKKNTQSMRYENRGGEMTVSIF